MKEQNKFSDKIINSSDEELINIINNQEDYIEETVELAKKELKKRVKSNILKKIDEDNSKLNNINPILTLNKEQFEKLIKAQRLTIDDGIKLGCGLFIFSILMAIILFVLSLFGINKVDPMSSTVSPVS